MYKKWLWIAGGVFAIAVVSAGTSIRSVKAEERDGSSEAKQQSTRVVRLTPVQDAELQQAGVPVVPLVEPQDVQVLLSGEGSSWLGVETHEVTADAVKDLRLPAERGV